MALSNDVLTSQLQVLEATVRGIGEEIRTVLPRMNDATESLQVSFKDMDDKLKVGLNPLVEADVISALKQVDKNQADKFAELERQIKLLADSATQQENTTSTVQSGVDRLAKLEPIMLKLSDDVAQMRSDFIGEKSTRDMQETSLQAQLATISAKFIS